MQFICPKCGKTYEYGQLIWRCQCGSYLNLKQEVKFSRSDIKQNRFNMWRYDSAYPIKYDELSATFNEGLTPLVEVEYAGAKIKVKLESLMPTGSFKDRGVVAVINYLKNNGAEFITEDSSGNAAASVGAYCALAEIKARIFVPAGNSSGKIMQTAAFGAEINPIEGTRDEVAFAAQKYSDSYSGHNWHPLFCQGVKSIAYEIWEQNDFCAPDNVIAPCGGGSLTLGLINGFMELLDNGEIEKMPRIFAVQPENCNPIVRAFNGDESNFSPKPTIAEGTSIANPVKTEEIVEKLKACGGGAISVSEDSIKTALKEVCPKGIYIEPTSATSFGAFKQMLEDGIISKGENTVIIASGNGLKAGTAVNNILFNR